ncbi:uncharacterized protein N7482_009256 [Penicillium canariense]|uniref:AB hydrolase-1 domain-containing protein n=1 Tax=Penicillium canariense TaxID=189055 RepID=A0A9W9HMC0_9EURO|nr:uncharacterized protein N7482_009256 [Penicillium canariense]KAJ5152778.1 hypothetical protein N7482_009256 [Penicillium canariense]
MEPLSTWERGKVSGMVSLPSGQHIFVSVCGPDRVAGQPLIIIVPGVACSVKEWAAVRRLLQPTKRVLAYERPGMGASEESCVPATAANMARDLDALLKVLRFTPPFVLVCHSYGGIIAREFLEHRLKEKSDNNDVVGMVFVDANQEKSIVLWPDPNFEALGKGLDWYTVTGLALRWALTDNEWKAVVDEKSSTKHQRTTEREMEHYIESCEALGTKKQLNRRPPLLHEHPISIIRGHPEIELRKVLTAGVEMGNGSAQQRRQFEEKLDMYPKWNERLQRENLAMSAKSRYRDLKECGHFIHMEKPEAIVEEIEWVLENI